MAISVLSLVEAGKVAKMGCRALAGDGSFAYPREGWSVISSSGDGGARAVLAVTDERHLSKHPRLL